MITRSSDARGLEGPGADKTDPGGPAPDVLEKAMRAVEPTLLYDPAAGRPRDAVHLARLVLAVGPRKGAGFAVGGSRTMVGRGADNAVVLPDLSVSRRHAMVEQDGGAWVLTDLGSGNGTRVNGRPVRRATLRAGDEIAFGDSVLRFVAPAGPIAPGAERVTVPARSRRRRAAFAAAVVALAAAGLAAVSLVRRPRQTPSAIERLARQRYEEGISLIRQARWIDAREKLRMAAELDGRDGEIARMRELAELEAPRAEAVESAQAALARNDLAGTRASLAAVPDDSALVPAARDVEARLRGALEAAAAAETGCARARGKDR